MINRGLWALALIAFITTISILVGTLEAVDWFKEALVIGGIILVQIASTFLGNSTGIVVGGFIGAVGLAITIRVYLKVASWLGIGGD